MTKQYDRFARCRRATCNAALLGAAVLIASCDAAAAGSDSVAQSEDATDQASQASQASLVIVVGAPGTDEYAQLFGEWVDRWKAAAAEGGASTIVVGREEADKSDRGQLEQVLQAEQDGSARPLWIVFIGHGTFDGRVARFNLRGPDVSAAEIASWLEGLSRPLAVINCASASAPFIDRLSGPERVIVTATKSGGEANFARFGDYLSAAISDSAADLDKDGQVSLLEAFLQASRQTQAYYDGQRQLATEHSLLDDNGDALGVRADFFTGLRPTATAENGAAMDGLRAHQWHLIPSEDERRLPPEMRRRRDQLERELAAWRERRPELTEDEYYEGIEPILVEIARLYAAVDRDVETVDPAVEAEEESDVPPRPGGEPEASR